MFTDTIIDAITTIARIAGHVDDDICTKSDEDPASNVCEWLTSAASKDAGKQKGVKDMQAETSSSVSATDYSHGDEIDDVQVDANKGEGGASSSICVIF